MSTVAQPSQHAGSTVFVYLGRPKKACLQYLPILVVLVLITSGCTHTAPLSSPTGRHKIEALSRLYPATIQLRTGGVERGYHLTIDLDSTRWRPDKTASQIRVRASSDIRRVSVSDPGRGVIEGLLIGGGIAGGAGWTFAKVVDEKPDAGYLRFFVIPGLVATGLLGPVVGGVRKSRHVLDYTR